MPNKEVGMATFSIREFESINQFLEQNCGCRLVWKSKEVGGRNESVDNFYCYHWPREDGEV